MMFMDPLTTICPSCLAESKQRVRDLLMLRAVCPNCQASLAENGVWMRRFTDGLHILHIVMDLESALEPHLDAPIPEDELFDKDRMKTDADGLVDIDTWLRVKTLRDLSRVVESRRRHGSKGAIELVAAAARKLARDWPEMTDEEIVVLFDRPLLDAIRPARWEGTRPYELYP